MVATSSSTIIAPVLVHLVNFSATRLSTLQASENTLQGFEPLYLRLEQPDSTSQLSACVATDCIGECCGRLQLQGAAPLYLGPACIQTISLRTIYQVLVTQADGSNPKLMGHVQYDNCAPPIYQVHYPKPMITRAWAGEAMSTELFLPTTHLDA